MTEHLPSRTIELLTGRQLAPADLLVATRHLATCAECRQKISDSTGVASKVQGLRAELELAVADSHPGYEQLEGYVDDSLAFKDREAVKQHLASCALCLQDAEELETLRDNLKTYPALAGVTAPIQRKDESAWERLAGFFRLRPKQLAFLTAALVLVAVVTVLLLRRPAPQQIVNKNTAPSNSSEPNQNAHIADANADSLNGNQKGTNGDGESTAESPYEPIISQALETQRLAKPPVIRELSGRESQLLGPSESHDRFALISPVATVVRNNRPTFRWQTLSGATSYSVAILDLNLNLVEKSGLTTKLNWTPVNPLKRNAVYMWQVTAVKDGREITAPAAPAREVRFRVLSSEKSATLTRAETQTAGSHLKLGIVYTHEGLLDDAERELRAAIAADQDAALARKLLRSVKRMRK